MQQTDMFQVKTTVEKYIKPDGRLYSRLIRKLDPATSVEGAKRARGQIKGQCEALWRALRKQGRCTMRELADKSGLGYYLCQKRISVLERYGKAFRKEIGITPDGRSIYEQRDGQTLWEAI